MSLPLQLQAEYGNLQEAQVALEAFKTENGDVLSKYNELVNAFNSANDAVKRLFKDDKVTDTVLGAYTKYPRRNVDGEELYAALVMCGMSPKDIDRIVTTKRTVTKEKYDAAIDRGDIPDEVAKAVESFTTVVRGPVAIEPIK